MQASLKKFIPDEGPAESPGHGPPGLLIERAALAQAIHHWGSFGDGGEPGLKLTSQASALVEVLARMDLAREREVLLPAGSRLAQLVQQALSVQEGRQDLKSTATQV